jgi:hypothetical protein
MRSSFNCILLCFAVLAIGSVLPARATEAISLDGWNDCDTGNILIFSQPEIYEFVKDNFTDVPNLSTSFADLQVSMEKLLANFAEIEGMPLLPNQRKKRVDDFLRNAQQLQESLRINEASLREGMLKVRDWNRMVSETAKTEAALLAILMSLESGLADTTWADRQQLASFLPKLQQSVQTLVAIRTTLFELQQMLVPDYNSKI